MSARKFKFVSPGVFINEIDNSHLPDDSEAVGPIVIGRLPKGPANRPVTVRSFSEFVEIFGEPVPGGRGGDVWREGNTIAPTYAAYAAQAYLRNSSPLTVVRTLGEAHPDVVTGGEAGWVIANDHANTHKPSNTGGAFGLLLFSSGSSQKDHAGPWVGKKSRHPHIRGGHGRTQYHPSGALAAVWYFDNGAIELSGNLVGAARMGHGKHTVATPADGAGNGIAFLPSDTGKMEFTAVLWDNTDVGKKVVFNFDRTSDKYIRKVFNTNPTLAGSSAAVNAASAKQYWLGETFDRFARDKNGSTLNEGAAGDGSLFGVIVGLKSKSSTYNWGKNQIGAQTSKSGWFFSQDLTTDVGKYHADAMQKLFRFVALDDGAWSSKHIKVSISDIKAPTDVDPYGSFTVTFRRTNDSDGAPRVLEKFSNCNLNPNSRNYIAAKIGDIYQEWDNAQKRYRTYGSYINQSRYLRVVMDEDVDSGITDAAYLPFGFYGPTRYRSKTFTMRRSSSTKTASGASGDVLTGSNLHTSSSIGAEGALSNFDLASTTATTICFITGASYAVFEGSADTETPLHAGGIFNSFFTSSDTGDYGNNLGWGFFAGLEGSPTNQAGPEVGGTGSIMFPSLPLRVSSSADGIADEKDAHFGISVSRTPSTTRFDESYYDVVGHRQGRGTADNFITPLAEVTEHSFIFTLDDLVSVQSGDPAPASVNSMFYASGSRKADLSYTAGRGSWTDLIDTGFVNFTAPLVGGFDGLDIHEREPFGDHIVGASGASFKGNYAAHSIKRAIDSVSDPEVVETNLITVPGVRAPLITNHVIDVAEARADALALIDIEKGGYAPATETTNSFKTRITNNSVREAVVALKNRGIDSSYACAYFPWVKILDQVSNSQVWVPPSVAALGTFASVEKNSELWFAPAGFTRGSLSEGAAGLPVISVSQRLSSEDRDSLYENNINPIATFPDEGIVIFGQKTLQSSRSALDRVNVRRLMIFVKKEISRIAARLLFDQNVQTTWNRFRGQVEPFLDGVKSRLGLTDFKVVLDETTTTPDLIDRNVMYAKIFLKPAKAVEFIAIDFVITNSGASFED